jgi:hypothetical protein
VSDPVPASTPAPAAPVPSSHSARVVVRPMPKVVFFYLTWLASLILGIVASSADTMPRHIGAVWMAVFAFNLLVISFDFNEVVSIAALFVVMTFVFAGLYFDFLGFIGDFLTRLEIHMNDGFYFAVFWIFTVIYAVVMIKSRFEYWEFRHNEVLHRTGVFGEIKRYSTEDLRWFKQIPDVLERILLRSGRMVLSTPREPMPIVIENVIGIESVDERIAEILGTKRVTMQ